MSQRTSLLEKTDKNAIDNMVMRSSGSCRPSAHVASLHRQFHSMRIADTPVPPSSAQASAQEPQNSCIEEIMTEEMEGEITFMVNKINISPPKPEQLEFMPYIY